MSDTDELRQVATLLEAAGLHVERVDEATTKRCDFRAHDDREHYLVEVKRIDDHASMAGALRECKTYQQSKEVSSDGSLRAKVEHAVKQLIETSAEATELRLVALVERRSLPEITEQALATLYGLRTIVDLDSLESRDCLYFSESAFFRHRVNLDGALIMQGAKAGLLVNDHSQCGKRVLASRLGEFFAQLGCLHDAERLQRDGGFLVADCGLDRSSEYEALQYLGSKYGMKQPVAMRSYEWLGAISGA